MKKNLKRKFTIVTDSNLMFDDSKEGETYG